MKKLETFLAWFKTIPVWRVVLSVAIPLAAIVAFLVFRPGADPVKAAISSRYPGASVEILYFRPAPRYTVDSLLFIDARNKFNKAADNYLITVKYYGPNETEKATSDSLFQIADSMQARFNKAKSFPTEQTTLCRYVAGGDTLTAVLDSRFNIIWPL